MTPTSCPDKSRLGKHLEGLLSVSEEATLISHLDECEPCRKSLEMLAAGDEPWLAVAREIGVEPPVPATTWRDSAFELDPAREGFGSLEVGSILSLLGLTGPAGSLGWLDHYALRELVGHGSMGVVFQAFDEKLRRIVAVKVLSPAWAWRTVARQRFLREARAAATIRDQHVVTVHSVEECRGLPYLVMEYIAGGSLEDWLDGGSTISVEEAVRIGREVALGLAAAHNLGLVHRDIKPANILLDGPGRRVKITDFGLARTIDDASLTQDGIVVGTPQFMAPEQARGEPIDHRADLFSLGGVLYRLCTNRLPFDGDGTRAVLIRLADHVPGSMREFNPEVPEWLDQLVARMLAKGSEQRVQAASQVAELLSQRSAGPMPGLAPAVADIPAQPKAFQARNRHRGRALAGAAALLAAASLGLAESSGVTHLSATLIHVFTPQGMLSIAVDDPDVKVSIEGEEGIVITGAGPQEVRLRPGSYRLSATRDGKMLRSELVTITRGGKQLVTINREPAESLPASGLVHTLLGHVGYVWSVAFLPDGRRAVSGGDDGTVRLWDLQPPKLLHQFQHGARLSSVAVTADGRFALSAGRSTVIKAWDLETAVRRPVHSEGHELPVLNLVTSRDGRYVLSCGDDKTIRLWDFATRAEKRCMRGHADFVRSVAFVPDGHRAVSGGHDHTVRLWDLDTGNELRRYEGNTDVVNCVAVSPDGRRVASANRDSITRIWDLDSGELLRSLSDPNAVVWVTFSPDGHRLLSGGLSWTVRLWNSDFGEPLRTLEGHQQRVTCVMFSPDGRRACSSSYDETIRLWQLPP